MSELVKRAAAHALNIPATHVLPAREAQFRRAAEFLLSEMLPYGDAMRKEYAAVWRIRIRAFAREHALSIEED